jgi:hypothetical protein
VDKILIVMAAAKVLMVTAADRICTVTAAEPLLNMILMVTAAMITEIL